MTGENGPAREYRRRGAGSLFAAGLIVYYIWFPSWGYFHADCADTILWAEATWDAGSLLNPDFAYACLLPLAASC